MDACSYDGPDLEQPAFGLGLGPGQDRDRDQRFAGLQRPVEAQPQPTPRRASQRGAGAGAGAGPPVDVGHRLVGEAVQGERVEHAGHLDLQNDWAITGARGTGSQLSSAHALGQRVQIDSTISLDDINVEGFTAPETGRTRASEPADATFYSLLRQLSVEYSREVSLLREELSACKFGASHPKPAREQERRRRPSQQQQQQQPPPLVPPLQSPAPVREDVALDALPEVRPRLVSFAPPETLSERTFSDVETCIARFESHEASGQQELVVNSKSDMGNVPSERTNTWVPVERSRSPSLPRRNLANPSSTGWREDASNSNLGPPIFGVVGARSTSTASHGGRGSQSSSSSGQRSNHPDSVSNEVEQNNSRESRRDWNSSYVKRFQSAGSAWRGRSCGLDALDSMQRVYHDPTDSDKLTHLVNPRSSIDEWMISPVSRGRLIWDSFAILCLLLDSWTTPFELIFLDISVDTDWLVGFSVCLTCFWCMDICLNFTTGYIDRDMLIMNRRMSVRKYLAGWFWLDVIATIPYDFIMRAVLTGFNPNFLSMTRVLKVTKVLKTIRFLKMIRAVGVVQNIRAAQFFMDIIPAIKQTVMLLYLTASLALASHINATLWAFIQPDMRQASSLRTAVRNYVDCFRWAFYLLTLGVAEEATNESGWTFAVEMLVSLERVMAILVFGSWAVTKSMAMFQDSMQMNIVKSSAMRFFRQHNVSIETQIQVMYSLHETREAQTMQRHFKQLTVENLPEELRRAVAEEIWSSKLLSLGLIVQIKEWHSDFLPELTMLVREEVIASKTVLTKAGNAAIASYYIIQGRLTVVNSTFFGQPLDFLEGMWVGEATFITPTHRRTGTIIARTMTRLMVVPAAAFHQLLERLSLKERFEDFMEVMSQGLCGRCGDLGDHFTHACPNAGIPSARNLMLADRTYRFPSPAKFLWRSHEPASSSQMMRRRTSNRTSLGSVDGGGEACPSGNWPCYTFLRSHGLEDLLPHLEERGVIKMEDLKAMRFDEWLQNLAARSVDDPRAKDIQKMVEMLQTVIEEEKWAQRKDELASQHLVFLSHFKLEAGTEAALIRGELEQTLRSEGHGMLWESFKSPIFLDSEDLNNLEDLKGRVRKTHNLVLLLTKNVLLRPWVLVEIVTAIRSGVRVVLLEVMKPGEAFVFPDDDWYAQLINSCILDARSELFLKEQGISLADVEQALRRIFKRIAVPYSPHRAENIRRAEVSALLKQIRLRTVDVSSAGREHSLGKAVEGLRSAERARRTLAASVTNNKTSYYTGPGGNNSNNNNSNGPSAPTTGRMTMRERAMSVKNFMDFLRPSLEERPGNMSQTWS